MASIPGELQRTGQSPRQSYSWTQRLRAFLYGRLPQFQQALAALAFFALVILFDLANLRAHFSTRDPVVETLRLLTFQSDLNTSPDSIGRTLYVVNALFSLLFVNSIFHSARTLFSRRSPQIEQLGLAATCTDHVIVCGVGRLGLRVITRLVESGYMAVVIEQKWDGEFVPRALELGVPVVAGDAREPEVLRQAGLPRARAIIAGIDDDLIDFEIAVAARALQPKVRVVLRAFSERFDQALERTLGAYTAFSVSALAAPTFAAAAISRGAEHVLSVGDVLLGVSELVIPANVEIERTVGDFERAHGVRVVQHVEASGREVRPGETRLLSKHDRLVLLGTLPRVEAACALNPEAVVRDQSGIPLPRHPTAARDTVIVCGHGKVGYRVVRWLLQQEPRPKVVVVHNSDPTTLLGGELRRLAQAGDVEEIVGDARTPEILQQAHIERAFAVAAVTSQDLTNLQVGMEARRQRADVHVVLRVFSPALAENLAGLFGIHTAFSTSELASSTLAAAAAEIGGVAHAFASDGHLFAMAQTTVHQGDRLVGQSVAAIRKQRGVLVAGARRGGVMMLLPDDEVTLAAGDEAHLVADLQTLSRLRRT